MKEVSPLSGGIRWRSRCAAASADGRPSRRNRSRSAARPVGGAATQGPPGASRRLGLHDDDDDDDDEDDEDHDDHDDDHVDGARTHACSQCDQRVGACATADGGQPVPPHPAPWWPLVDQAFPSMQAHLACTRNMLTEMGSRSYSTSVWKPAPSPGAGGEG
jgi:hypothetical protein